MFAVIVVVWLWGWCLCACMRACVRTRMCVCGGCVCVFILHDFQIDLFQAHGALDSVFYISTKDLSTDLLGQVMKQLNKAPRI